jgi:hypothetical protein
MDVLVFAKTFKAAAHILDAEDFDDPVLISGYIKSEDDSRRLIAQKLESIPAIRAEHSTHLRLDLRESASASEVEAIKRIIEKYPGECHVDFSLKSENNCQVDI